MDLSVKIGKIAFNNPVWVASGTFGYGKEFEDFLDVNAIGAVVTKTVTLNGREGNIPPRIVETPSGLLNSIGLENKGIDVFLKENRDYLKALKTRRIISVAGNNSGEIENCVEKLNKEDFADAVEINLSCPNVSHGSTRYKLIAQDPGISGDIIAAVKKCAKYPVIAKLTPNVTDIADIARAVEKAGADAISLVNTFFAMAVDAEKMSPVLGNVTGGLSGPAIKPMALRAVWEVYRNVSVPVIGMGGITTGTDAAEFMLCGARAVQVGTYNFVDPSSGTRILNELKEYLKRKKIKRSSDLVGKLKI